MEIFAKELERLKESSSLSPLKKTTLQECVGENIPANKENVRPNIIMVEETKISYLDVCRGLSSKPLAMNSLHDTHTTVFN